MNAALNAAIPDSESARRLLRVIDAGLENDDEAARHGPPAPHCGVLGAFRYALGEPNGDTPTPWTLSPCMMYILDGLSNCCWWIDHEAMHALAFEQTVEPESIIACLVVCDHFHGSTDRSSNVRANPLHQLQELLPIIFGHRVPTDLVSQWRIDRDDPTLLAQFDCQKAAGYGMIGCDGWQGVYCSGFHQYLLCALVAGPKW